MKNFSYLFFLLFSLSVSAQNSFIDSIINPLQKNQLVFEKVFIHTNKTSYLNDDTIWFKAYVGENSNKPSLKTTLLYVNLFDGNGKFIFSNNVLIHKGVGQGQFELSEIVKTDVVYLQGYTNNMRNFGEENYFLQKIKIINNSSAQKTVSKNQYDIQVFPEGGYLLEDTENTIGIKSLINGKGVDFTGEIVDSKSNQITSFKNEYLGMSKCSFVYKSDELYSIIVKTNDTIIKKEIPSARKKGVVLKLDNSNNEYLNLDLKTNIKTLGASQKEIYTLLFHQKNQLIDFLKISNLDSLNFHLEIHKKVFYNGVNTLTVFKGKQPICERKFYVNKPSQQPTLKITKESINNDSIEYKILVLNSVQKPLKANLSLSVLSLEELNTKETTHIKSAFLLSPYVKGTIENPFNYFNEKNRNRYEQLDLLLLTQGWAQYLTNEMISNLNSKPSYGFEQGFNLRGSVTPLLTNSLGLMSKDNILIDKLLLNGKTEFSFNKLLVYKGDSVKISFFNNQNIALKPKNILLDSLKLIEFPKLNFQKEHFTKIKNILVKNDSLNNTDITRLDVVKLKGKKRSAKYVERKKFIKKHKKEVFDIAIYNQLELDGKYSSSSDLMHYLSREENVNIVNWNGIESYLSTGLGEAALFIDGKRVHSSGLLDVYIKMEDVENIAVLGVKNRVYQVFTTDNYKKNIQELFIDYIVQNGYNTVKKYYSPNYYFENDSSLKRLEIDWKPELKTNEFGEISFKIKNTLHSYLFSINGFSENGILINYSIFAQ